MVSFTLSVSSRLCRLSELEQYIALIKLVHADSFLLTSSQLLQAKVDIYSQYMKTPEILNTLHDICDQITPIVTQSDRLVR